MPDEVQKSFVRSIVGYLKKQVDSHLLSADSQESIEVAIQCLQAGFDVGDDEDNQSAAASADTPGTSSLPKEIDLFELFQSMYIERNPETLQMAETIKNEGNRLMKEGKYNEALLQYNRAVAFDPKNPIFYCNRAAAYIRLGDSEKAIIDCKSALVYNPNYGKAYGRLGIAYSNVGKYDEAQQAYTKAIELEPENQDYRNNLEVARNARNHVPQAAGIPNLTEGLRAMLGNPAIRNLFSSAEIDLEQLQTMSQNPAVMSAVGQLISGVGGGMAGGAAAAGGAANGAPPQIPAMPNDLLQLFQSFASQLAQTGPGGNETNQQGGGGPQEPPPAL